jgi:hypothetical protein
MTDIATGLLAYSGVLAALFEREKSGMWCGFSLGRSESSTRPCVLGQSRCHPQLNCRGSPT